MKAVKKKRKEARRYEEGDLVAVKRTQFGPGLKLFPRYLRLYRVSIANSKDRYIIEPWQGAVDSEFYLVFYY